MLTFALPTGRSFEDCIEILEGSGLPVEKLKKRGRNLVVDEGKFSLSAFKTLRRSGNGALRSCGPCYRRK